MGLFVYLDMTVSVGGHKRTGRKQLDLFEKFSSDKGGILQPGSAEGAGGNQIFWKPSLRWNRTSQSLLLQPSHMILSLVSFHLALNLGNGGRIWFKEAGRNVEKDFLPIKEKQNASPSSNV